MSSAYGQHRTPGSRLRRRRRRRSFLLAGGSLTAALTAALSLTTPTGADLANAAVERAESFLQLMSQRSPGERVKGELTKTKRKHYRVLAERESPPLPTPPLTGSLVDIIAPPAALLPASLAATPLIVEQTPPPGVIIIPPPPGGIVIPCCGAGPPPPGPPPPPPGPPPPPSPPRRRRPPPPPPPPPPPVPEPGTWMTMILGFGLTGWMLRRRRTIEGQAERG